MPRRPLDPEYDDRPLCGANKAAKNGGGSCQRPAGWGTSHAGTGVCKLHGGTSPASVVRGERVLARRALASIAAQEVEPDADPLVQLAKLSASLQRSADYLSEQLGEELVVKGRPSPLYDMWARVVSELRQALAATTRATAVTKLEIHGSRNLDGDALAARLLAALEPWPDAVAAAGAVLLELSEERA